MNNSVSIVLVALALLGASACTASTVHVQAPQVKSRYLITMADTERPYQSLGLLQLTRKGADLFGFISLVDADVNRLFGHDLIRELQRHGADGIINIRFRERQWTTAERVIFALPPMFLFPLPTKVELTGEMVRFIDRPPGAAARR